MELFCNIQERFKTWWQTFFQITKFNVKIIKIKRVRLPSDWSEEGGDLSDTHEIHKMSV